MEETAHVWDPLSPAEAQELFSGLSAPWWISGGWAIDLFIGHQTRPHGDLDVLILRDDQLIFQKHLSHWDLSDRRLPDFTTWSKGDFLDPPINDIWGRRTPESPWAIQLMLMETDGDSWVFRREPTITGPISSLGRIAKSGIPYLSPQIQLLYKANNLQINRNNADFKNTLPFLNYEEAAWLRQSLELCYPGHEWISKLSQRMKALNQT